MAWFPILRLTVLGKAFDDVIAMGALIRFICAGLMIPCAIVAIALGGAVTSFANTWAHDYNSPDAQLAIVTGSVTVLTLPIMCDSQWFSVKFWSQVVPP